MFPTTEVAQLFLDQKQAIMERLDTRSLSGFWGKYFGLRTVSSGGGGNILRQSVQYRGVVSAGLTEDSGHLCQSRKHPSSPYTWTSRQTTTAAFYTKLTAWIRTMTSDMNIGGRSSRARPNTTNHSTQFSTPPKVLFRHQDNFVTYTDRLILLEWWSQLRLRWAGHVARMGKTKIYVKTFHATAIWKLQSLNY